MAGNRIDVTLSVNDDAGTLRRRNQEAKELNRNLTMAAQLSEKVSKPAARRAQEGEGTEYGRARGSMGTTGASARDFANQAQGLGGLVRLYATVAANLFAVGAAFNALREAMNTSNMIQGLNQLGAASGQSLGSLAKNLATASGGALSMREAMEATVKATSSGLGAKQLQDLGKVARNAAQALGLSMPDAVSRLTRGITKLEPELLDELGLFTKLDMATQKYALSIGKSTASLTDFERRQAFANAVLAEGLEKFGEIEIPTNPYDKLLASLKNLAQTGLEVVNKVLGPLIDTLSQSPTALTAGIVAIGAALVKQALPAIGEYRAGLRSSSEAAAQFSQQQIRRGQAARAEMERRAESAAEAEIAIADRAVKKLEQVRSSGFSKQSKAYGILQKAAQDVTKEELNYLEKLATSYANQKKDDIAQRYREAAAAIRASAQAEEELAKAKQKNLDIEKQRGLLNTRGQQQIIADRAAAIAASKGIISGAAETTQGVGPVLAFQELFKNIADDKTMGPLRKVVTGIVGTVSIGVTALTTFVSAIQGVLFTITAIVGLAKGFDAFMTGSAKQTQAFNDALDASQEALDTYSRTMDKIAKTSPEKLFSSEVLMAEANAFKNLTNAIDEVNDKFKELEKAKNEWDKFRDSLFIAPKYQDIVKFAEQQTKTIAGAIVSIKNKADRQMAEREVAGMFGLGEVTQLNLFEAIIKLGPEAVSKVASVNAMLKQVGYNQELAANKAFEFDESVKKLNNTYKEFVRSTLDSTPATRLGTDMVNASLKLANALQNPTNAIGNMKKLLEETAVLGLFDPNLVQRLNALKPQIESLNRLHGKTKQELEAANQELVAQTLEQEKLRKTVGTVKGRTSLGQEVVLKRSAEDVAEILEREGAKFRAAQQRADEINARYIEEQKKIQQLMQDPVFKELVIDGFTRGAKITAREIDAAFQKAKVDLGRGIAGLIGDVPGMAKLESELNKQEYAQREALISVQRELINATNRQTAATNMQALSQRAAAIGATAGGAFRTAGQGIPAIEATMTSAQKEQAAAQGMAAFGIRAQELVNNPRASMAELRAFQEQLVSKSEEYGKVNVENIGYLQSMNQQVESILKNQLAMAEVAKDRKLNDLKTQVRGEQERVKLAAELNKQASFKLEQDLKDIDLSQQRNGFLTEEQISRKGSLQNALALRDLSNSLNEITTEYNNRLTLVNELKALGLVKTAAEIEKNSKIISDNKEKAAQQEAYNKLILNSLNTELEILRRMSAQEEARLRLMELQLDIANIRANSIFEAADLELDLAQKRKQLTPDEIKQLEARNKVNRINQEESDKFSRLQLSYYRESNRLLDEAQRLDEGSAGDARRAEITAEVNALSERYGVEKGALKEVSQLRREAALEDAKYTTRQLAYADAVEKAFQGMADALIDFVKTGKLNFSSLIASMIEGLIRFEMQLLATMAYQAARPGIMAFLSTAFGQAGQGPGVPTGISPEAMALGGYAKGAAFVSGIEKFAKGGMFTNKIVSEPTLFKFAKGTGMMGEAGPEAIMPLRRDGQGNLGVIAQPQQGNVEVVVNNYSGEKAETKETVDNRGNRKIEVVIGEMVASEVGRKNSPMQQAIGSNFMTKPAVVRR